MSKSFYEFWLITKPFRSMWIVPLLVLTFTLLIFYFFGHSDEMRCSWEVRDRWECYPEIINES